MAFAPDAHLVGLGAVARLVDVYVRAGRALEQIGQNVVGALARHVARRRPGARAASSSGTRA